MAKGVDLALVIPFHNEERYLPTAIASLRNQCGTAVPIVFVDNGSTDRSAVLVRQCTEVQAGRWICIEEPKVGKFFAMAAGVAFCARQLGAQHVGFLDADSYYSDTDWLQTCACLLGQAGTDVGYIHSPYRYVGIEHMPTFAAANQACAMLMRSISERVGWFANSAASVYSTALLTRYFYTASVTTELGLRCSLLALSEGQRAYFNRIPVMTSARRIVANRENLAAWCFYDRQYYLAKDINATTKRLLSPSTRLEDLPLDRVGHFFSRQAVKFASRNLIPLALFDRNGAFGDRLSSAFGLDVRALLCGELRSLRFRTDLVLTDQFERLLSTVACTPLSSVLAERIEQKMRAQYEAETGITPPFSEGTHASAK